MLPNTVRSTHHAVASQTPVVSDQSGAEAAKADVSNQDLLESSAAASPAADHATAAPRLQAALNPGRTLYRPLQGKKAFVTGGSRGIGAAIVQRLTRDGAQVTFTYSSSPGKAQNLVETAQAEGGVVQAVRADAGNPQEVKAAVDHAAKTYGGLDIVVNNAAILHVSPLQDMPLEHIDQMLAVNVRGTILGAQAGLKYLPDGGRIINIGSVNADHVSAINVSLYALTKGAIASFSRGLARELGPRGITVNTVQPGPIDTDMNPAHGGLSDELTPLTALRRYGRGPEVAGMVAYLAGPDGDYVTGAQLNIDGGFTA